MMWKNFFVLLICVLLVDAKCPDKWTFFKSDNQNRCIKYFDHPVNFSEAQYICNEIYNGDLISISSLAEQKALLQYLHNEIGFKRSPVTWLGARILNAADQKLSGNLLKWIDGSDSKFDNFAENFEMDGTEKCVKILSLVAKGKQSTGLWTADICSLRDSGFVCQLPYINEDRGRSDSSGQVVDNTKTQFLIKQMVNQFTLIKELCDSQIKLIEKITNQFQLAIQGLSKIENNEY